MVGNKGLTRRALLGVAVAGTMASMAGPAFAALTAGPPRRLAFYNLHTGEKLAATYWADGSYVADELGAIDHLLRDFRTGDVHPIDPRLLDLLHALDARLGGNQPFHVISGYRSPASNAMLHAKSSGVATRSLHMDGKAVDIRVPGRRLADLRQAALALRAGGVGYYPKSDFVHVDTGRVRRW
jgi:uncharacterized protein YcbK (DUF882 family)